MRRFHFLTVVAGLTAATVLPLEAQVRADPPSEAAVRVYQDLVRQFGSARTPPRLEMGPTRYALVFLPQQHAVRMSAEAYQVARAMGDDTSAALAYLLGHELAHFYADHVFARGYRQLFRDLGSSAALEGSRVLETETQSDFLAGFKSYLAGYDALAVAPDLLRAMYREFPHFASSGPASDDAHPPLEDRLRIVEIVRRDLDRFTAGFEGGIRLLVVGAYPEAGRFFGRIAQSFPSREILSNAGVAKALEALALLGDDVRWAYPFEIDLETRLRGDRTKGGLGLGGDDRARAMRLLAEAEELFDKAKAADPDYIPAYVNLAAVNVLAGNTFLALGNITTAQRLAREQGERVALAHAGIVRGIALAMCEDELAMCGDGAAIEAEFSRAAEVAPRLAAVNLAAWRGESPPAAESANGEFAFGPEESIGGLTRDPRALNTFMNQRPVTLDMEVPAEGDDLAMNVRVKRTDEVEGYFFGSGRARFAVILSTPEGYTGESGRGIRIGSSTSDLTAEYGEPGRVIAARQGEFWVYDLTMIAFLVNEHGTVDAWMIWDFLER